MMNLKDIPFDKRIIFFGASSDEHYDNALKFIEEHGRNTFLDQYFFSRFVERFMTFDGCYMYDRLRVNRDTGELVSVPIAQGFTSIDYVNDYNNRSINAERYCTPSYIEHHPFLIADVNGNLLMGDKPYRAILRRILLNEQENPDYLERKRSFSRAVLGLIQSHYNDLHSGYIPTDVEEMVF